MLFPEKGSRTDNRKSLGAFIPGLDYARQHFARHHYPELA